MVSCLAWVGVCAVSSAVLADPSAVKNPSLQTEIRAAMRATLPSQGPIDDGEARRLLSLYQRLQADRQLPEDERQQLAGALQRRLVRAAEQIHRRVERQSRLPGSVKLAREQDVILAQQQQPPPPPAPQAVPLANNPPDAGDELARLIVETIAPQSWDVNGGNGSIYYYRQWQCLVVRQTDDIHRRVGRLVVDLRRP